jgi:hypothetical protein
MKERKILGKGTYFGVEVYIFNVDLENNIIELGYFKDSVGFERSIKCKGLVYGK